MRFRPCIDIHNGQIKQIVGGSLMDQDNHAQENYVSVKDGTFYGELYRKNQLPGGHVILLNPKDSPYYEQDREQAVKALQAFPGGLQIGGGINEENAAFFLEQGASHVIVTSYVFVDGEIRMDRLKGLCDTVGKEHVVLDLSCRKKDNDYYVVTNRWQKFTHQIFNQELLGQLEPYCDEYLIHGVDVEGMAQGIDQHLVEILGEYQGNPVTYAGGVRDFSDLDLLKTCGKDHVDVTIGSSLDLFGGTMEFEKVLWYINH